MSADAWFAPGDSRQAAAGRVVCEGAALARSDGRTAARQPPHHPRPATKLPGGGTALGFGLR